MKNLNILKKYFKARTVRDLLTAALTGKQLLVINMLEQLTKSFIFFKTDNYKTPLSTGTICKWHCTIGYYNQ